MESLISFLKTLTVGLLALVPYFLGRKDVLTDVEKQAAEKALELELNARKAQEQINRRADDLKRKIPNSWDDSNLKSASVQRKASKSRVS